MTNGLAVYLGSADMVALERGKGPQLALLRRCAATMAMVLIESNDERRQPLSRIQAVCKALRSIDVAPILYSFPSLTGDLVESRLHYEKCTRETGAPGQWDIEPKNGRHWTPVELAPLLACDSGASITSTRHQLPKLGDHGREVWLQLESQESTDTLGLALRKAPHATIVLGLFDAENNPRTTGEVRRDLERCTEQAKMVGRLAVWSLASMSVAEADLLREWSIATWRKP